MTKAIAFPTSKLVTSDWGMEREAEKRENLEAQYYMTTTTRVTVFPRETLLAVSQFALLCGSTLASSFAQLNKT